MSNGTLTASVSELRNAIEAWAKDNDLSLGSAAWHTREEWKARAEDRGLGQSLVLCTEGGNLYPILDFSWACWTVDPEGEALYESWCNMLSGLGYGHEIGYGCFVFLCELNDEGTL